ncbi:MAG: signal recognition particle receptor subunit alpha, partial [Opitutales bacterium]
MLESLTERMGKALRNLRGVGKLSERNVDEALKEVRTALLSADVHFKVVREFIEEVKASCLGEEVLKSVAPGQQIVKFIHDALVGLLGEGSSSLSDASPLRIVLAGLHGAGKTTTAAKLANRLAKEGRKPFLVACDVYRPAAIDQLETLAREIGFPIYLDRNSKEVPKIARAGWEKSKEVGADLVIFDTAGRLQIDDELVDELRHLKREIEPHEILLVADSALGQEAVNVADRFNEALGLTGLVLTKVDG